jgi:two-component system response regulator RegA
MTPSRRYLIVDDDPDVLKAAAMALAAEAQVDSAPSPQDLEIRLRVQTYDAVLLDMNFALGARDGREGFDALERVAANDPSAGVILMTTYGGVALAVEALKRGAVDFILKPWRNEALVKALSLAASVTAQRRVEQGLNLEALERRAIAQALARHEGNVSRAAHALGLTRPALYRRMARHGL